MIITPIIMINSLHLHWYPQNIVDNDDDDGDDDGDNEDNDDDDDDDGMSGSKVVTVDRQTLLDASASLALLCPFIYNLISMIIIINHSDCGGC